MLQIGKTYRLKGKPGDVDIVGSGISSFGEVGRDYEGQFFVGITRDEATDWMAAYTPEGTRLWDDSIPTYAPKWDLRVPEQYVSLNQVREKIRARYKQEDRSLIIDQILEDLYELPTKGIIE